jgi:hypothetical protein
VEVIAGVGAALATILADLHDIGVSHGGIEASHVLLDNEGRPVLCSFGQAQRHLAPESAARRRQEDVRALARLILDCCPDGAPKRTVRALRLAAGPGRRHSVRDARWLARQLISTVPRACLSVSGGEQASVETMTPDASAGTTIPAERGPSRLRQPGRARQRIAVRPRSRRQVLLCVGAIGGGAALVGTWVSGRDHVSAATSRPSAIPCPAVDRGCGPLALVNGTVVTAVGRYRLSPAGDVVVVGRWACGSALPAVLNPTTGEVWTFAAWPAPRRPEAGQLAARVPSGASLRVQPGPSGCDRLFVERRHLRGVTIDPAPR